MVALECGHDGEGFGLLRTRNAALFIADEEEGIEVPFEATADWGYLRLRRPDYRAPAIKKWISRPKRQDWEEALIFFKHEDKGKGPKFATRLLELAKG